MAIGYRLSADEIATLLWLTNNGGMTICNINNDQLTVSDIRAAFNRLVEKGILILTENDVAIDPIYSFLILSFAEADNFFLDYNEEFFITYNSDCILYLQKDKKRDDLWHIFPYEKVIELIMDERNQQKDDYRIVSAVKIGNDVLQKEITWKEACERMVQLESDSH